MGKNKELKEIGLISHIFLVWVYLLVKLYVILSNIEYFNYSMSYYPVNKYLVLNIINEKNLYVIPAIFYSGIFFYTFFKVPKKTVLVFIVLIVILILNEISLVVENEFFDCGCALYYKTSNIKFSVGFLILLLIIGCYVYRKYKINSISCTPVSKLRDVLYKMS